MLDQFQVRHPRIAFASDEKWRIRSQVFEVAQSLAARGVTRRDQPPIDDKGDPFLHRVMIYELMIQEIINEWDQRFYPREQALLEAIALIMVQSHLTGPSVSDEEEVRRCVATTGGMIQDRLTRVLLETPERQFFQLWRIGSSWGMNRSSWEQNLTGAAAAARAILDLSVEGSLELYPATIVEDVAWGIDLLVKHIHHDRGIGLSIKARRDIRTYLQTEEVPSGSELERADWDRVSRGMQRFNEVYRRNWIPAVIRIGRHNGSPISIAPCKERQEWTKEVVRILHEQRNNAPMRVTA